MAEAAAKIRSSQHKNDDFRELESHRQAVCRIRDLHAGTRPFDSLNWLPTLECLHGVCRSAMPEKWASEEVLAHGGEQLAAGGRPVSFCRRFCQHARCAAQGAARVGPERWLENRP